MTTYPIEGNSYCARDLRAFRELVETYFERSEVALDDLPADWEGARAARAQINRMLPRVIQIVHCAGLDAATAKTRHPGPKIAGLEILRNIFSARPSEGQDQEILDVIDMATGVYDATRFEAIVRTINPFHYVTTLLAYVGRLPVRAFTAVFNRPHRSQVSHLFGENAEQMVDLAERLEFAERVIAQQRPMNRLKPLNGSDVVTPVYGGGDSYRLSACPPVRPITAEYSHVFSEDCCLVWSVATAGPR